MYRKQFIRATIILSGLFLATSVYGQQPATDSLRSNADTLTATHSSFFKRIVNYFQQANVDKTQVKKVDFSIIGGPHYSSDNGFGLGIVGAALYRLDKKDTLMPPSNTSLYGDISTTGFALIGIRGNALLKSEKYRFDYNLYFYYKPSDFWGVGYDAGENNAQSEYKRLEAQFELNGMIRIAPNTYLGTGVDFDYVMGKDFTRPDYLPAGQDSTYINVGAGFFFLYDSRDLINNAYKGFYLKLDQRFFPSFFGNKQYFGRTELTTSFYHAIWKGAHMAYDLHGQFNYGAPPWTMIAQLGGPYRMRGYYMGRYRDNNILEFQAELRQKIYRRSGIAVWVGAGNVFPAVDKMMLSHTLPNYGLGYRWEFKKRVNVRLDYGFGKKGQNGFMLNINEAF